MNPHFQWIAAATPAPVIVEVPHAGLEIDARSAEFTRIPARALELGALFEDSDLGADLIWEGIENIGVTRVVARASRYVIDLNTDPRPPPRPPFYEKDDEPRSFLRRSNCGMNWTEQGVPKEERRRRIEEVLEPYHAAVEAQLDRSRALHGAVCLVSAHTFPDRRRAVADIVLGTRRGSAASATLRDAVADVARSLGFTVALEEPFQGGWSLVRHARPSEGVHAIQIEIARRMVTGVDGDKNGAPVDPDCLKRLQAFTREVVPALTRALRAREIG